MVRVVRHRELTPDQTLLHPYSLLSVVKLLLINVFVSLTATISTTAGPDSSISNDNNTTTNTSSVSLPPGLCFFLPPPVPLPPPLLS